MPNLAKRNAIALLMLALSFSADTAWGQMFGPRALGGGSVGRQPSPGQQPASQRSPATSDPATNTMLGLENAIDMGMSRFLRENRGNAFVGRDRADVPGFIGNVLTANEGAIQSAVDGLTIPPPPNVNRARPEPMISRPGPYRPRLSLGFEVREPASNAVAGTLQTQLSQGLNGRLPQSIQVEVVGRRAILSGEVASAHDRILAEELVRLEPGISEVVNQIQTQPSSSPAEPAP